MNKQKRNLLKGSLAGVTGLAVWQTPVVNTVLLPVHAQMTTDMTPPQNFFSGSAIAVTQNFEAPRNPLDFFISPVNADYGFDPFNDPTEVQLIQTGVDEQDRPIYDVTIQLGFVGTVLVQPSATFQRAYTGQLTLGGDASTLSGTDACGSSTLRDNAKLISYDPVEDQMLIQFQMKQANIPSGTGSLSQLSCGNE